MIVQARRRDEWRNEIVLKNYDAEFNVTRREVIRYDPHEPEELENAMRKMLENARLYIDEETLMKILAELMRDVGMWTD